MQNLAGNPAKDGGRHHSRKDKAMDIGDLVILFISLLAGVFIGGMLGGIYRLGNRKVTVSFGGFILAYGIYAYTGLTPKLQILAWSAGILIGLALSLVDSGQLTKLLKGDSDECSEGHH